VAEYEIDLNDLGVVGVVADVPGYLLPPEGWTTGHNIRFEDGIPIRLAGQESVFGTPPVAPHFLLPISGPTQPWWLYTSLTKAYVFDGTVHTDITRLVGGDYTTALTRDLNGTILGGIPIINNGSDVPQYWASYSAATKMADLLNWPVGYKAKILRAFGPQLVAFNITKSGVIYPHNVLWSHTADPGTLPSSWDITDTTKDTGEQSLSDVDSGMILDAQMLRGNMYIGKENSIWRMRFVGGRFIYAFDTYLETAGLLAPRCMGNIGLLGQQALWTQDDILLHNGSGQQSLLTKKWRRTLFADIDATNYRNSFLFDNARQQEMWFCYPTSGTEHPNRALVWNYSGSGTAFSTVDVNFRNIAFGIPEVIDVQTWEDANDTWEDDDVPWNRNDRRRGIACLPTAVAFRSIDQGLSRNGTDYTATLQRTGLSIAGRKRNGEWIVDFKSMKTFKRVWLKLKGGPVLVRVGAQMVVDGPVTWRAPEVFDPSTQMYVDIEPITGRAMAIEISSTASAEWKLFGYRPELNIGGYF
jgi:hypothetical protein